MLTIVGPGCRFVGSQSAARTIRLCALFSPGLDSARSVADDLLHGQPGGTRLDRVTPLSFEQFCQVDPSLEHCKEICAIHQNERGSFGSLLRRTNSEAIDGDEKAEDVVRLTADLPFKVAEVLRFDGLLPPPPQAGSRPSYT